MNKGRNKDDEFVYEENDLKTISSTDSIDIQFRIRVLADLLVCPLCDGFFKDAMTIKECLHTFCGSCIILRLNQGISICPVCHTKVSTNVKESVQRDVTIQNLVDKIFPHFIIDEEKERIELMQFCESLGIKKNTRFFKESNEELQEHQNISQQVPKESKCIESFNEWLDFVMKPAVRED